MNKVLSKDGTPIAFETAGSGPALLLVHGTGSERGRWAIVLRELSRHFTVCMMDRRGRGGSGDSPDYTFEREIEDIVAVSRAAAEAATGDPDGPVDVLGHSFGAACVLASALHIPNLRRLVLYEPPMLREQQTPQRAEFLRRMDEALAAGDREAVVLILSSEMLGIPRAGFDRLRGTTAWANTLAAAHTIPRELKVSDVYGRDLEAFRSIQAPTLFLLGTASPASFRVTTETLCGLIPNSRVANLEGQQHSAMLTAPALFTQAVIGFLTEQPSE